MNASAARFALSSSDLAIEIVGGAWKPFDVSGEKPVAMLALCAEGEPVDPCTVRAELNVEEMIEAQHPASLRALQDQWHSDADGLTIVAAHPTSVGGREAVERVFQALHSVHIRKQVYFDMIVLRSGDTYYSCTVTMDPPDFFALGSVAREACASLHAVSPHSG